MPTCSDAMPRRAKDRRVLGAGAEEDDSEAEGPTTSPATAIATGTVERDSGVAPWLRPWGKCPERQACTGAGWECLPAPAWKPSRALALAAEAARRLRAQRTGARRAEKPDAQRPRAPAL